MPFIDQYFILDIVMKDSNAQLDTAIDADILLENSEWTDALQDILNLQGLSLIHI